MLGVLSCARLGYESLPEGSLPDEANLTRGHGLAGSGGANDAGTDSGGVPAGGAGSVSGSGGTGSSPDAGDTGDGGGAGGASNGGTSGATLAGCEPAVPSVSWSFTGDTEGWQLEADPGASGDLSWTGATGDPAPGALAIDATVANGLRNVRAYLDQGPSDLTGKVLYARVFLE
ncbi:MAG TPA: hypothetical protein VJU61_15905, partial [Polyangiaceae bacterium]|nr:hypothetical protein [Polyangiaceae bacterium]